MVRYVTTVNGRITLKQYIAGVKYAKAHPQAIFKSGLTCWWSCSGADIMSQFMEGIHDRINQGLSYSIRGL